MKVGYAIRIQKGRNMLVHPTKEGQEFKVMIEQRIKLLHDAYCDKLGKELVEKPTSDIGGANLMLAG